MNTTQGNQPFPAYAVMIKNLFKPMEGEHSQLMHAAIGFSGETTEFAQATSRKHFIEEAGDLEFYLEAMRQQIKFDAEFGAKLGVSNYRPTGIVNAFDNITSIGGEMLDACKKSWVYKKPVDDNRLSYLICAANENLDFLYEVFGTEGPAVLLANQNKLIGPEGRFRDGFYSDMAAQQRADKVADGSEPAQAAEPVAQPKATERNYIGKTEHEKLETSK